MIRGREIVCLSTTDWDYPWGSRQQLMTRFAKANRVLFVEYQSSFLHTLLGREGGRPRAHPRLRRVNDNLYVYTPKRGLPFGYYSLAVNAINQMVLGRQIRELIRLFSFRDVVLWVFAPCSLSLIGKLGEKASVYHAIDLYKEEIDSRVRREVIHALERRHVPSADLVFASSRKIVVYLRELNDNIFLYPSAADGSEETVSIAADFPCPKVTGLVAGIVGTIDERFDYELISYLSEHHGDITYIIVGPMVGTQRKRAISALAGKKNIMFIGEVDRARVPACIKRFDVCLLPYKKTEFTDAISPIKVFEYLLQGKPVVATDLDGLRDLGDAIYRAKTKEEFGGLIRVALSEQDENIVNKRVQVARKNTWEDRYCSMSQLINDHLSSRGSRAAAISGPR